MLYPVNFEQKLGFDKIRELLRNNCISALGARIVDKIKYLTDFDEITKLLNQASEFRRIIESGESFPLTDYFDYGPLLVKASKYDAWLMEDEFHNMKISLTSIERILGFFSKRTSEYPELTLLMVGIYLNPNLLYEISRVIDEHGKMKDNASPELAEIRNSLKKQQLRVRKIMEKMLGDFISEGFANDDANVTIRNGRLVLPVRAEYKRSVGGFIHDESATGLTAFIEPASALEVNNEIMDLEHREKREMVKILSRLTDRIRPEIPNLQNCLNLLGTIDFIRAKAKIAALLDATAPVIDRKPRMQWTTARHPLLYLSHKSQKKSVIPLDIELTTENRILIISGPNAGGKSVCLKTVGLIQYMMQCGLLVPLSEGSVMGIFNGMLADIGDEQSIENDLSTYSSHLISMKTFLAHASGNILFLIDEFGTGTEPQFGGAIAESILEHLLQSRAFGIITTHYTNLKRFAEETPGAINGAMRFDLGKMEPLFILDIGKPGSSFAIEIARKIGLPSAILNAAEQKVGTSQVSYEKLLGELESEKIRFSEETHKAAEREKELKNLTGEYENLKSRLEENKKEIINEAKSRAREIIQEANKAVENTIREIRESQAEKNRTREAREKLDSSRKKINVPEKEEKTKISKKQSGNFLKVGSLVRIKDQDTVGQVLSVQEGKAEIAVGQLKMRVSVDQLEPAQVSKTKKAIASSSYLRGLDVNEKMREFRHTLDIRGMRGEEAVRELDVYLDLALLLNMKDVKILHGKGNGILRKLVRERLRRNSFISGFSDEDPDQGGSGITRVTLK